MKMWEIISELEFKGSTCTKDCSGHKAGYAWSKKKGNRNCDSRSPSFNKGCEIAKKEKRQPRKKIVP